MGVNSTSIPDPGSGSAPNPRNIGPAGFGAGEQARDFIHVEDAVAVTLWSWRAGLRGIYNCGTGQARSFKDLTQAVYGALDKQAEIEYIDTPVEIRAKYQYFTQANMDRIRAAGYDKPFTSLEDGVREYVTGFLDTDDPYR